MVKLKNIYFISLITCLLPIKADFNSEWVAMQKVYNGFLNEIHTSYNTVYNKLVHPDWHKKCNSLKAHILGNPVKNFLIHPTLLHSMIRSKSIKKLSIEENFLINQASSPTKQILSNYKETSVGGVPWANKLFNLTGNSVGQLYFFGNILELKNRNIKLVVEFGGGYGNLARIAKMCIPDITYLIIDLPEICAIQSLYLNLSLPGSTKTHLKAPSHFEPGFIHIVPVYLLNEINIKNSDVFVSTFAITESTLFSQNIVANKNFFGASLCFIVGLVSSPKWVNTNPLIMSIKNAYTNFSIQKYQKNNHINQIYGLR